MEKIVHEVKEKEEVASLSDGKKPHVHASLKTAVLAVNLVKENQNKWIFMLKM